MERTGEQRMDCILLVGTRERRACRLTSHKTQLDGQHQMQIFYDAAEG